MTRIVPASVPLLGSIPILGALFRSTNFQKGETELLIVVTPRLVAPIRPGQVRLPTDRVKDPSEVETILMGEPYHPQELKPAARPTPDKAGDAAAAAKKDSDYAY